MPPSRFKTILLIVCACFFLLCLAFIPLIGIQNDEALFATVVYGPILREFRLRAFGHDLPLMVMTYLGALKSWVYAAIYGLFTPSLFSLRIPPAVIGAATIAVFSAFLSKATKSLPAAIAAAFLLALDPSFLLMTVYDWGPVAFQHLFLVCGCYLLWKFANNPDAQRPLFLGFFCLGMGLWDKALLSWSLIGLSIATVSVFHRELRQLFTLRRAGIAILGFLIGGAPLVLYNVRHGLKTFRGNAKIDWSEVAPKWVHAKSTLDGSALFGYLVREEWEKTSVPPAPGLATTSYALREAVGERRQTLGYWAFLISALAVPLWWRRRRAAFFALIYLACAWTIMAATKDAGASAHHVVLLWPFPQFVIALAFAGLADRGRWGVLTLGIVVGVLSTQNFLVLNQYYTQATRFCGGTVWTDAMDPLHKAIVNRPAPTPMVNLLGWGTEFTLIMLEKGKLPLRNASVHVAADNPSQDDRNAIQAILGEAGALYVGHVEDQELQPGLVKRFDQQAASFGYRREEVQIIADRCGRPMFELFRYVPAATAAATPSPK
ncbi:hypothetical protein F183_A48750 [Bryobacterales bacterium F-183]|nr:hypothetical protein F183_A48750 [Bryobacterales bacterium F-183]